MESIETRYPFASFADFFAGGYYLNIAGIHLALALIGLILGVTICLLRSEGQVLSVISMLYFALQPFNNPMFTLAGLSVADVCGIITACAGIVRLAVHQLRLNNWILAFTIFGTIAIIHGAVVWTLYPAFGAQADVTARYVVIGKIFVFLFAFSWIYSTQDITRYLPKITSIIANFAILICLIYAIQLAIFLTGHLPYGTFTGSGSGVNVAFGGVSIERGHLSKFMAPLFVPIAIHCYLTHRYWKLIPYLLIMVINFSASGLSFLVFQLFLFAVLFSRQFWLILLSWRGMAALIAGATALIWFADAYGAIINKIYRLAIVGDDEGGRSVGLMIEYLKMYPLGIGYSGSTYRTAPGLAEINMGLYEFLTQLSIFSLPFLWLLFSMTVSLFFLYKSGSIIARFLLVGVLSLPLVFSSDSLWFVPLWWLPAFVLYSYRGQMITTADAEWASRYAP